MQDSRILSTFQDLPASPGGVPLQQVPAFGPARELVFDTCQVGVVLRAVMFVQAVAWVMALYGAQGVWEWVMQVALFTAATLPSLLIWLLVVCALKRSLARLPMSAQWAAGMLLGAISAIYGCGLLSWTGLVHPAPWLASAASGALIAAALVRAEPAKAETLLEDLSELFRHALADSQEAVPLRQELALAEHYLAIEQVRFGDRLRVEWHLDAAASEARLPPLILQPLVENAVKHGVEPSPSGAVVRISTQRRGSTVVIKVTNTVPAGSGARGNGLALDNVRQRLALLHDVEGRFQSALVDGVFQVRLEIPI